MLDKVFILLGKPIMKFSCHLILFITIFLNVSSTRGLNDTHEYMHSVFLDDDGKFLMKWSPKVEHIIFEIQVKTTGYAGLGFSPDGFMKGSDIVIVWVNNDGFPEISDRHAIANSKPLKDASQDWNLLGGSKNETHLTIRLSRNWITCDGDDFELNSDTMRVIWAYHPSIPERTRDDFEFYRHTSRGMKSLLLVDNHDSKEPTSFDVKHFDIRARNVTLPAGKNDVYLCHLEKVPTFENKQHIIGVKPILNQTNIKNIHHIVIYLCRASDIDAFEKLVSHPPAECYVESMPTPWQHCQAVIFAWAVGSEGEMFPESAGVPIGGGVPQYFLIEFHYDNPKYQRDIVDNSGLRLYYTEKLRKYDSAMLTIGHSQSDFQVIPPGVENWTSLSYCFSSCLSSDIPKEGINITSVMFHTHLIGRAISVHVYRNGSETQVLSKDDRYDFDYQQSRVLKEERTILPGDQFVINCTYDTRDRNYITSGGPNITEELCYAFLMYYPMINTTECASYPTIAIYEGAFDIRTEYVPFQNSSRGMEKVFPEEIMLKKKINLKDFVIKRPEDKANVSVLSYLQEVSKLTPHKFKALQKAILSDKYKYIQECIVAEGTTTETKFTEITIPTFNELPEMPKAKCPTLHFGPFEKSRRINSQQTGYSSSTKNQPGLIYTLNVLLILFVPVFVVNEIHT